MLFPYTVYSCSFHGSSKSAACLDVHKICFTVLKIEATSNKASIWLFCFVLFIVSYHFLVSTPGKKVYFLKKKKNSRCWQRNYFESCPGILDYWESCYWFSSRKQWQLPLGFLHSTPGSFCRSVSLFPGLFASYRFHHLSITSPLPGASMEHMNERFPILGSSSHWLAPVGMGHSPPHTVKIRIKIITGHSSSFPPRAAQFQAPPF